MFVVEDYYRDFIKKYKKKDLLNILNDYHLLCDIYNIDKGISIEKKNKEEIIEYLDDNIENYIEMIIRSLDNNDLNVLNYIIRNYKKLTDDYGQINKKFIHYLIDKKIIYKGNSLTIPIDIYNSMKKILLDKDVKKDIKENNEIYEITKGFIIAYGVVDIKKVNDRLDIINSKSLDLIKYYYKKDYQILKDKLITDKLTNKTKIKKYFDNKTYKEFKNKELRELANNKYHHHIKSYHKLIKTLKTNYVFKERDIKLLDKEVVIPYLYNSLNEEDVALKNLEDKIKELFEFKDDKLQDKMILLIKNIRNDFPLWEYRGFAKSEV